MRKRLRACIRSHLHPAPGLRDTNKFSRSCADSKAGPLSQASGVRITSHAGEDSLSRSLLRWRGLGGVFQPLRRSAAFTPVPNSSTPAWPTKPRNCLSPDCSTATKTPLSISSTPPIRGSPGGSIIIRARSCRQKTPSISATIPAGRRCTTRVLPLLHEIHRHHRARPFRISTPATRRSGEVGRHRRRAQYTRMRKKR